MGKERENRNGKTKGNAIALMPIGVFLVLYLGLGILFEYVMKIPMGFYNVPIVVAFLAAILVACLQNRAVNFEQKLEIMSGGVGDKNIITTSRSAVQQEIIDCSDYIKRFTKPRKIKVFRGFLIPKRADIV